MSAPPSTPAGQTNPRAPLALAAVAFACGIWLAEHLHRSPQRWGIAALLLVACAVVAAYKARPQIAQAAAILALACVGAFTSVYTAPPRLVVPPQAFLGKVEIVGHVIHDSSLLAGPRQRFDLESETIIGPRRFEKPVVIRTTLYPSVPHEKVEEFLQEFPQLAYGDRVLITTKLRLPRNFHNPGAFDYESYLHNLGISAVASVSLKHIHLLDGTTGTRLGFWRSRVRRSILDRISGESALWNKNDAPLLAAMIIGEDGLLLRDVREEFQQTGVYHLLVVSGMNVGLLAFAVFWLARRLRAPDWLASLVTVALSIFYAEMAGMGVPIQRAVIMLSMYLFARLLYRERPALNATGFAALVVLVLSPHAMFEAGFQLTFLALLAISGISLPVLERSSSRYHVALQHLGSSSYDLTLDPQLAQLRLDLRLIWGRLARFLGARPAQWLLIGTVNFGLMLFELTVVSTITQATLALPMRAWFHRAAILGLPANILVLPLAGILLNSAVAALALSYVSTTLARVAAFITGASLHWMLHCIAWLGHLRVSRWRVPDAGLGLALLAVVVVVLAFMAVRRRRKLALSGLALLFLASGCAAFYSAAPQLKAGKLEITAIDVGQGDSLLLVSPQGRTMLVDAGGSIGLSYSEFDYGEDVVSPYLWSRGLERLDVVLLTHAHGDHIGGLARVIQNFRPRELWVGINPDTVKLEHVYKVARQNDVRVVHYTAGEQLNWGGTHVRFLSPPAFWQPHSRPSNNDSLTFVISYRQTSALLAGDLEKGMERFIATETPHVDLLKVAHHGSNTSTTPELLQAAQPRFAVISDGYHNRFHHPRPEVLARLQAAHVRTFRTDMLGAITFLLDGKNVEARPYVLR